VAVARLVENYTEESPRVQTGVSGFSDWATPGDWPEGALREGLRPAPTQSRQGHGPEDEGPPASPFPGCAAL